jgi:hypothetical protein
MVAVMTIIGILWIPVVQNVQGGQLFIYIQAVSAYFSPPIACLYLLSIFWTKATEKVWVFCDNCIVHATTRAQQSYSPDTGPSSSSRSAYFGLPVDASGQGQYDFRLR